MTSARRPRPGPGRREQPRLVIEEPPGTVEGWAAVDPTGVATKLVQVARRAPFFSFVETRIAAPIEAKLLHVALIRARALLGPEELASPGLSTSNRLADILEESLEQTPLTGREQMYHAVLDRLVSDEVRILAAIADGSVYPVVHVAAARNADPADYVLSNASSVGRMAGVVLPEFTPAYVGNIVRIGLARVGPEDPSLKQEYELLLTEGYVVSARAAADNLRRFPLKARIVKRTLRVTDFGRELWESCRPPTHFEPLLLEDGTT